MAFPRRITKNGHSRGVNLPSAILEQLALRAGDAVLIELRGLEIVISRALTQRQLLEAAPRELTYDADS